MEKENFINIVSCKFAVITHEADCNLVTNILKIEPDRFYNKGDIVPSKYSNQIIKRPYGVWEKSGEPVCDKDIDISTHINYYFNLFKDKLFVIDKLKNEHQFECILSISIATDDAGVGIDFSESEMDFIKKISTRLSISFISKENL